MQKTQKTDYNIRKSNLEYKINLDLDSDTEQFESSSASVENSSLSAAIGSHFRNDLRIPTSPNLLLHRPKKA